MTIEISPESLAKLDAAVASGAFASREEALTTAVESLPIKPTLQSKPPFQTKEEADAWVARFRAWTAAQPSKATVIDDSRETIYGGRGE